MQDFSALKIFLLIIIHNNYMSTMNDVGWMEIQYLAAQF